MSNLDPVAFDIETSGFEDDAVISVAGFAHGFGGDFLICNRDSRPADQDNLEMAVEDSERSVRLDLVADEHALLEAVTEFATNRIDDDQHYLTAFNGGTWSGGFDLPFCRTRFLRHGMDWPLTGIAYADMMDIVDRFNTTDQSDLVGVYDVLIGEETCDPFTNSIAAVDAFEGGDWGLLLNDNLADIRRTLALAELAE